jgi:hypothetical protein
MSPGTSRISSIALFTLTVFIASARAGSAQSSAPTWAPEVSGAIGIGHVFRFQDQAYGDEPNVSGSIVLRHRRGLAFEVEANRTLGLTADAAPCAVLIDGVPVTCTGSAREGVLSATSLSFNVQYLFTGGRVQPYLLGGLGILRTRSVSSITSVRNGGAMQTEEESSATGIGPDIGGGLRFLFGRHFAVGPEVRWLEAASLSRHNLAVTRASVRAAYSW